MLVCAFAACGGHKRGPESRTVSPAIVLTLPSLGNGLEGTAQFVDAVAPGLGERFRHLVHPDSGADDSRPAAFYFVSSRDGGWKFAATVGIADRATIVAAYRDTGLRIEGSWAVIGDRSIIEGLGARALDDVQRPPPGARAVVDLRSIVTAHEDQLAAIRKSIAAAGPPYDALVKELERAFDGLLTAARTAKSIRVELDASVDRFTVTAELVPEANTLLATFIKAQRPATFRLLERIPGQRAVQIIAGEVHAGPYQGALAIAAALLAPSLGASVPGDYRIPLAAVFANGSGEFACVASTSPLLYPLDALMAVSDSTAVQRQLMSSAEQLARLGPSNHEVEGLHMRARVAVEPAIGDGVAFATTSNQIVEPGVPDALALIETRWAGWDDVFGVSAYGTSDSARRLVARSREQATLDELPAHMRRAVADARARGDSVLLFWDLAAQLSRSPGEDGIEISIGATDGKLRIRASITAAQARQVYLGVAAEE